MHNKPESRYVVEVILDDTTEPYKLEKKPISTSVDYGPGGTLGQKPAYLKRYTFNNEGDAQKFLDHYYKDKNPLPSSLGELLDVAQKYNGK